MPTCSLEGAVPTKEQVVETSPDGRFRRFDVILGKGAFKTVYKAFDEKEGTEVAWNALRCRRCGPGSTKNEYAALLHEINVLKKLKHKNIMTFYDSWVDREKETVNFITELFTSGTLRQYRQKHKKLSESVLKRWAWQILQGLVYLHGHDPPIIHRDLKCDNIFVNGSSGTVKIGDLGLATLVTQPQSVLGTPEFMAPEMYDEKYDEKVDVYAFGMCMLELCTLQYPYSECTNAVQVFKRVSMGLYPEGLKKVENEEMRQFIQLCITHSAASRPEARQLLKHSFFDSIRAEKDADISHSASSMLLPRESDTHLPRESDARNIATQPPSPAPSHTTACGQASTKSDLPMSMSASPSSSSGGDASCLQTVHTGPASHPVSIAGSTSSLASSQALSGSERNDGVWAEDRFLSRHASGVGRGAEERKASRQASSAAAPFVVDDVIVEFKKLDSREGVAKFEMTVPKDCNHPSRSHVIRYEFCYNPSVDTSDSIKSEMQSDLKLSSHTAAGVAEYISQELERAQADLEHLAVKDAPVLEEPGMIQARRATRDACCDRERCQRQAVNNTTHAHSSSLPPEALHHRTPAPTMPPKAPSTAALPSRPTTPQPPAAQAPDPSASRHSRASTPVLMSHNVSAFEAASTAFTHPGQALSICSLPTAPSSGAAGLSRNGTLDSLGHSPTHDDDEKVPIFCRTAELRSPRVVEPDFCNLT